MFHRLFASFVRDDKANAIMLFGLAMPVVLGASGVAVDVSVWVKQKDRLQVVADLAAVAGVKELTGSGTLTSKATTAATVAKAYVDVNAPNLTRSVAVDTSTLAVKVSVQEPAFLSFANLFGITPFDLAASSSAVVGDLDARPCILALDETAKVGVTFTGTSKFEAVGCLVWSNSLSEKSIEVGGTTTVKVSHMCAAGEIVVNGSSNSLTGTRQEKCEVLADPLKDWTGPASAKPCIKNFSITSNSNVTLSPGTYCGGLSASSKGSITLQPGIYVIDGGPLKLTADSSITGTDVGIYLTGKLADVTIAGQAEVALDADDEGAMDGIVLASDRTQSGNLMTKITGGSSVDLVGTVYLPSQDFVWRGNSRSGNPSEITQVIAKTVDVAGTTDIYYEADFEAEGFEPIETYVRVSYVSH